MVETTVPIVYVRHKELPVGASRGVVGLAEPVLNRFDWEGDVATEITDYGLELREGMKGSIDAAGMAAVIDQYIISLLEKQDSTFANVFRKGYGNFTNTLVNYNDHCDDQGKELEPIEGFARASVIHKPKDFRYGEDGNAEFEVDENSKIIKGVYVPKSGFMALEERGLLNPRTGLPYLTVGDDKDRSVESFTSRGFPRDIAEFIASYFFARSEGEGVGAVGREYWDDDDGSFGLDADYDPGSGDDSIGRLASSLPSGASRASQNEQAVLGSEEQVRTYTEVEYKEAVQRAETAERTLSELRAVLGR